MEKNGKASSSKCTKHIKTRYYFVTDHIKKYEISLEWCPTADIIGDFMTKPTQGAAFKRFRDKLMGVTEFQYLGPGKPKKYREDRVSNHGQKAASNTAPSHK